MIKIIKNFRKKMLFLKIKRKWNKRDGKKICFLNKTIIVYQIGRLIKIKAYF